jgi:hypothetical protein
VVSEPKLEVHPVPQRQVVLEGPLGRRALGTPTNPPTQNTRVQSHARETREKVRYTPDFKNILRVHGKKHIHTHTHRHTNNCTFAVGGSFTLNIQL